MSTVCKKNKTSMSYFFLSRIFFVTAMSIFTSIFWGERGNENGVFNRWDFLGVNFKSKEQLYTQISCLHFKVT